MHFGAKGKLAALVIQKVTKNYKHRCIFHTMANITRIIGQLSEKDEHSAKEK